MNHYNHHKSTHHQGTTVASSTDHGHPRPSTVTSTTVTSVTVTITSTSSLGGAMGQQVGVLMGIQHGYVGKILGNMWINMVGIM